MACASRSNRARLASSRDAVGQDLDGHLAVQPRVAGAIDLAHASGARSDTTS
jgi:hypothetical protein